MRAIRAIQIMAITTILAGAAHAADSPDDWVARMLSLEGQVDVQRPARRQWQPAEVGENYLQGDQVRTAAASRARLLFRTENYISIDQRSFLTVPEKIDPNGVTYLELSSGQLRFRSHDPSDIGVNTPFVNALHRGTEFQVEVKDDQTVITVYDGTVEAKNDLGTLSIEKGQSAIARKGEAPRLYTVVKPEDAVQWSLFYPPVIDFSQLAPAGEPFEVNRALSLYRRNQLLEALAALDAVPAEQRTGRYLNLRAGLLLTVGRVEQARPDILEALKRDPKDATALAQQAVVAVANNDKDTALKLAEQAVAAQPKSSAAKLALSYALQSHFRLEEAREAMRTAHQDDPRNALVLTRLAELELSLADMDKGEQAAAEALSLNPKQARAKALLGFAKLMNMDTDEAIETFQEAVKDDDADPLARFGFGLAKIRKGDLDEGTQEIETAASISPDDPLIRSYLGKAYYEQKRSGPSEAEYEIAKKLDPKDPTPYFYDAIKKQTENRPVEALRNLQKAIELNGNRGVYRSRQLLDSDLAARSAAEGRLYADLGFQLAALANGWISLNADRSNYSAHRLLADSYSKLRRHELARTSEILQSQLLQPQNLTPIQPRLVENSITRYDTTGPGQLSFNEFNPLFARNRLALLGTVTVGSQGLVGEEVTQSGIHDKTSYSLGQYHYQLDGFQKNNALDQNIYTGFVQHQINEWSSLQSEFRYNQWQTGQLDLHADAVNRNEKSNSDRYTVRVGGLVKPFENTQIIGNLSYSNLDFQSKNAPDLIFGEGLSRFKRDTSQNIKSESLNLELQAIANFSAFEMQMGGGYFNEDRSDALTTRYQFERPLNIGDNLDKVLLTVRRNLFCLDRRLSPLDLSCTTTSSPDLSARLANVYLYPTFRISDRFTLNTGVSLDMFSNPVRSFNKFNPKVGLIYEFAGKTFLRGVYLQTTKRPLVSGQTIEPVSVAGFNQFYDDFNGTNSDLYGVGVDSHPLRDVSFGFELSWRKTVWETYQLQEDRNGTVTQLKSRRDTFDRAYLLWTAGRYLSLSLEYYYQGFYIGQAQQDGDIQSHKTHELPLTLSVNLPDGLFSQLSLSYINQKINTVFVREEEDESSTKTITSTNQSFLLTNLRLGYRFPKRYGIATFGITNLFDKKFTYKDLLSTQQSLDPQYPTYFPERIIYGQVSLAF